MLTVFISGAVNIAKVFITEDVDMFDALSARMIALTA